MEKYQYSKQEIDLMEQSHLPFAIYQFINNRVVTLVLSKGFLELFDLPDSKATYDLMDNDMYCACHPDDIAELQEAAVLFATKDEPYDIIFRSKVKENYRLIHSQGKHIYKDGIKLALILYIDEGLYLESENDDKNVVLSNIYIEKNKKHIIQHDYLTGLPSISYFFYLIETSFLQKTLDEHKKPTMLFLDLNGMKFFNAKYGFAEGDKLIQAFSRLLTKFFSNEYCCRFGMDRFCVYTNDDNLEDRLWALLSEAENINDGKTLPVRIGIYSTDIELCSASMACDRAKMACDSNKTSYLSHFSYFNASMLETAEKRRYIIENIDNALNNGWIKVFYQPIVRAANGKVCDEEALSRWIDPEKGFMNPDDFIPTLEDANLIYKLDLFVTDQVLLKMEEQAQKGLYIVPISVNLSRSDFDTCDIVEEIYKRVKAAGIPPEKLTIEITESIIGSDFDYMKTQINRFQAYGFKVWMDDFGSGYSSLDVLHDLRFDLIKFDMKFMKQFYSNEKTKILLTGLMKTASALGIETICEGVETEHQVEFLKEVGCTKLQGYYFCQPIPPEKVYERYEKGIQIGFENPDESEYYSSLGKINLYDLSVVTNTDSESFGNFFNTPPMSILETDDKELRIIRGNKSYREFLEKYFSFLMIDNKVTFKSNLDHHGTFFVETIRNCQSSATPIIIDEKLQDGTNIHVYMRRIAVNPVNNKIAIVTVILGISGL